MAPRALTYYGSTIGKKQVMAISGLIGVGFILGHMTGHLLTFKGAAAYNAYAHFLKNSGALLWGTRFTLLAAVALHVHAAFSLWSRNNEARPRAYYQRKDLATNYAALTMRYGGITLLLFLIYHLAHFTWGVTEPVDGVPFDPDNAYNNLVLSFQHPAISGFYIVAMGVLGMHLYHGIWSLTQSLGLDHPKYNALRQRASMAGSALIVIGFIIVPVSVLTGVLQPVDPATGAVSPEPGE
ncbi:MAG: succinate dehydrogenase (or fumarate reductase) cytochrome b subunit, b558 family [Myxococcaceae bacterium]|nr:succinate dehydrogenase (or fumarate reductase) cytochrome b subunit, b558 family [Myxococcaceae bacterium]